MEQIRGRAEQAAVKAEQGESDFSQKQVKEAFRGKNSKDFTAETASGIKEQTERMRKV